MEEWEEEEEKDSPRIEESTIIWRGKYHLSRPPPPLSRPCPPPPPPPPPPLTLISLSLIIISLSLEFRTARAVRSGQVYDDVVVVVVVSHLLHAKRRPNKSKPNSYVPSVCLFNYYYIYIYIYICDPKLSLKTSMCFCIAALFLLTFSHFHAFSRVTQKFYFCRDF